MKFGSSMKLLDKIELSKRLESFLIWLAVKFFYFNRNRNTRTSGVARGCNGEFVLPSQNCYALDIMEFCGSLTKVKSHWDFYAKIPNCTQSQISGYTSDQNLLYQMWQFFTRTDNLDCPCKVTDIELVYPHLKKCSQFKVLSFSLGFKYIFKFNVIPLKITNYSYLHLKMI